MGPISKEQLTLHFDFGRHFCATDAESLRERIKRVKPSLLVLESAFIPEDERKRTVAEMNGKIESARGDEISRNTLFRELFDHCGLFEWPDFGRSVLSMILAEPGLRMHLVESSPPDESAGDMFILPFMMNAPIQALRSLYGGDAEAALLAAEKGFRSFNDFVIVRRNEQALEGFRRLAGEIPELHPSVSAAGPIAVLSRFGLAHAGMADQLKDEGFRVDSVILPAMDHSTELTVRYSKDPSMGFSPDERKRILFDYALCSAFDGTDKSQEEDAIWSRALFASLGGGDGFMRLALALAEASASFEDFQLRLRNFLENAQKGIYSTQSH